jgi:maltooligosyltrehalose trehalohydrolase
LIVNLGSDLVAGSIADPLVAPEANARWRMLWSSEDVQYGGAGAFDVETETGWCIPGHSAVALATEKQ